MSGQVTHEKIWQIILMNLKHFADDVWALQRLLWTSWLCRRSIRHYSWLSFHQSLFFLVHKSSTVWENGGKVTDSIRLHKQGRYLQSGVRTKGIVLLVRLVEKKCTKRSPRKAFKQNRSQRFGRLTYFPCSQFGCTWSGRWKTPWRTVLLVITILILVNWWDTHMLSRMPHVQRGPRARLGRSLGVLRRQPWGSDLHVEDMIIRDTWSTWQSEGYRWQLGRQDALPVGWEEMQELWNVSDEHCRSQQTDLESLHQWQEESRRRKVRIQWKVDLINLKI